MIDYIIPLSLVGGGLALGLVLRWLWHLRAAAGPHRSKRGMDPETKRLFDAVKTGKTSFPEMAQRLSISVKAAGPPILGQVRYITDDGTPVIQELRGCLGNEGFIDIPAGRP